MSRFLIGTRYLILIPILGLAVAAAGFFVFGGIGLIQLIIELVFHASTGVHEAVQGGQGVIINGIVILLLLFDAIRHVRGWNITATNKPTHQSSNKGEK